MKVKNIMFSGFAAAVLAGACGAADAATYTLASKDYVTNQLKTKEHTLTTGDGITITRETDTEGNVTSATISADLSTVTVEGADGNPVSVSNALTGLTQSVAAVEDKLGDLPDDTTVAGALAGKQDALENANVLESITQDTVDSIGATAGAVADLETTVGDAESGLVKDVADLETTVGNAESGLVKDVDDLQASVATKAEAQALTDGLALKEDVANKLKGESVTDADLTAEKYMSALTISKYVQGKLDGALDEGGAVTTAVNNAIENAVKNGEVGQAIENAVANKQDKLTSDNAGTNIAITTDADGKVTIASTYSYDDTELSNAVDSLETTVAGKADASAVTALSGTVETLSETVSGLTDAETGIEATYATKAALQAVSDVADAAQTETEVKNTIESYGYQTAEQVEATIDAGKYLSDTMTEDGSYLVTKKGDTVSYASVSVIDGQGNVMTLQ